MKTFPWGHERRFNAYAQYFKKTFGERVQKLSIDAGFTCPNRDGTKAYGGCTYCNNDAFSPSYCQADRPVAEQIRMGMAFHESRYKKASKYLAYFQNYSNTYAPLEKLKQVYDQALRFPEVTGLVIGTRPDVIDDEKLEYFARLSEKMYVVIEYGIESVNNETLKRVNRQHTYEDAVKAIEKTASYGIRAGGHLMFGFPGETPDMMLRQVEKINQLPLHSIKFHQLQIMKDTVMARQYRQHPERFDFFRLDTYVDFIIDFVEKLHPDFIIERFSGEASPQLVISPQWGKRTHEVLTLIENRMKQRDTWQGKFYAKPTQSVHVA